MSDVSHIAGEDTWWDHTQLHDPVHFIQSLLETGKKILKRSAEVRKFSVLFPPFLHNSVLNVYGCVDISTKYVLSCRCFYFAMQLPSAEFLPLFCASLLAGVLRQ